MHAHALRPVGNPSAGAALHRDGRTARAHAPDRRGAGGAGSQTPGATPGTRPPDHTPARVAALPLVTPGAAGPPAAAASSGTGVRDLSASYLRSLMPRRPPGERRDVSERVWELCAEHMKAKASLGRVHCRYAVPPLLPGAPPYDVGRVARSLLARLGRQRGITAYPDPALQHTLVVRWA